jgi:hypothetical protein
MVCGSLSMEIVVPVIIRSIRPLWRWRQSFARQRNLGCLRLELAHTLSSDPPKSAQRRRLVGAHYISDYFDEAATERSRESDAADTSIDDFVDDGEVLRIRLK